MSETYEQPTAPLSKTPRLNHPSDVAEANEQWTANSAVPEAHSTLVSHYVRILKGLSSLRPIGERRARQVSLGYRYFVWRSLVRLFSEQHIRRQLSAISRLYALQLGVAISRSDVEAQWLDEAQRSCEKVLGAISSWQRLKLWLAVASPIVGGFIVAGLGVDDLYAATFAMVTSEGFKARSASLVSNYGLLAYFVIAIAYFLLPFWDSFSCKRELFYPATRYEDLAKRGKRRLERRSKRQGLPLFEDGPNVYDSEDRLYALLETRKKQELRLDTVLGICSLVLVAIGHFVYLAGAKPSSMPNSLARLLMIVVTAACIYGVALLVYRTRRKRWR